MNVCVYVVLPNCFLVRIKMYIKQNKPAEVMNINFARLRVKQPLQKTTSTPPYCLSLPAHPLRVPVSSPARCSSRLRRYCYFPTRAQDYPGCRSYYCYLRLRREAREIHRVADAQRHCLLRPV